MPTTPTFDPSVSFIGNLNYSCECKVNHIVSATIIVWNATSRGQKFNFNFQNGSPEDAVAYLIAMDS